MSVGFSQQFAVTARHVGHRFGRLPQKSFAHERVDRSLGSSLSPWERVRVRASWRFALVQGLTGLWRFALTPALSQRERGLCRLGVFACQLPAVNDLR